MLASSHASTVTNAIPLLPVFHGQPCPFCDSTETVVIEIDTDTPAGEPAKLRVISGGRRDEDERRAA